MHSYDYWFETLTIVMKLLDIGFLAFACSQSLEHRYCWLLENLEK